MLAAAAFAAALTALYMQQLVDDDRKRVMRDMKAIMRDGSANARRCDTCGPGDANGARNPDEEEILEDDNAPMPI